MESKLNRVAMTVYANEFSSKICDQAYLNKDQLTGKEILNLTNVKAVNLFTIKVLFEIWKRETASFKSQYFDFEHEEVKAALKHFMNIVSNHILIDRKSLLPLLKDSVEGILKLLLSPYDFFVEEVKSIPKNQSVDEALQENEKFYQINKHLYLEIITKFKGKGALTEKQRLQVLDQVFADFNGIPEDLESYLPQFNQVLPLEIDRLYDEDQKTVAEHLEREMEKSDDTTINDYHSDPSTASVADSLKQAKIDSLNNYLSVNQRFMFVIELFRGDKEKFEKTIEFIDRCTSKEEVFAHLEEKEINKDWKDDSEEAGEFLELIKRKFEGLPQE